MNDLLNITNQIFVATNKLNKCIMAKCYDEKIKLMKDKDGSSMSGPNIYLLKQKNKKEQEKQIIKWMNNSHIKNLYLCEYNNCKKIFKTILLLSVKLVRKSLELTKKEITQESHDFINEFEKLLKAQKLTQEELSILFKNQIKLTLLL